MNRFVTCCCPLVVFLAFVAQAAVGPWDADVSDFPRMAGETGDAARIQRAVTAAGKGGVVWFPRGDYAIDTTLVVSNQASLLLHKSAHLKAVREMPFVLRYFGRTMEAGVQYGTVDHNLFIKGGDIDGAGLAGNAGLVTYIGDSHFTDVVVVDYTVGISDRKWSNRFTRCHIWGGLVKKAGADASEYLPDSIAFDLRGSDAVLTDCYADTAMTGFRVCGGTRIFNCGYFNNCGGEEQRENGRLREKEHEDSQECL